MANFKYALLSSLIVLGSIFLFQNCGNDTPGVAGSRVSMSSGASSNPGPIDGNYKVLTWTCGSNDLMTPLNADQVASVNVAIANSLFQQDFVYSNGCAYTSNMSASYPSSSEAAVEVGATTCSSMCSLSQCTPAPAASPAQVMGFSYSVASGVLTLVRQVSAEDLSLANSVYSVAGCAIGDQITMAMQVETIVQ